MKNWERYERMFEVLVKWKIHRIYERLVNFHICTMNSDVIQYFISPTNAKLI